MSDLLSSWSGDQAAGLRRLFGGRSPQVIAFASGREACGRTTLVVQTAAALAAAGHGVVIIDENPAPDNAVSAFGLASRYDLMQAVRGARTLRQVTIEAAPLIHIVPAASAARDLDALPAGARGDALEGRLQSCLREIQRGAGFVLIDTATRRSGQLSALALAARHVAIVVAAHGAAITQAYALIKRLAQECGRDDFRIIVTRAKCREEGQAVFDNMRRVAREHLGVTLHFLGEARVPVTDHVAEPLLTRLPASDEGGDGNGFLPGKALRAARRREMTALDSVV